MAKRLITSVIGIAILVGVLATNNMFVLNIAIAIIALLGLSEFYGALKKKSYKPIEVVGSLSVLPILGIGYLEPEVLKIILFFILPVAVFILFFKSIYSKLKHNIVDISLTIMGIIYVPFLFSFIPLTRSLENGAYYIWYILAGAWVTDTFAYLVGVKFGKHKFSEISPKKSIEGSIGGILGCMLFFAIYSYFLTTKGIDLNVTAMTIAGFFVSIISQIGDLAASSIKRFCDVKDYSNLMPGHGGILDRFDSIIMIAPFIYAIFQFIV